MLAGLEPGLSGSNCFLDGRATGVPNLGFATALPLAADAVISTQAQQYCRIVNFFSAKLRSHIRKIDIARFLISNINPYVAACLTTAVIIGDRSAAARGGKSAAGSKPNVLHPVAKGRVHHQCLESRTGNIVFVKRAIQERFIFSVVI